jgi:hypothetical protein
MDRKRMRITTSRIVEVTIAGIVAAAFFGPARLERFAGASEPNFTTNSRFHDECAVQADKEAAGSTFAMFGSDSKRRVALEECIKRREAVAGLIEGH